MYRASFGLLWLVVAVVGMSVPLTLAAGSSELGHAMEETSGAELGTTDRPPAHDQQATLENLARIWTCSDGRRAKLTFVSLKDEMVRLRRTNGSIGCIPLAKLSAIDQAWIAVHAPQQPPSQDAMRTWTCVDGRKATLAFVDLRGEVVQLKPANGRIGYTPLARLSAVDRKWIAAHTDIEQPRQVGEELTVAVRTVSTTVSYSVALADEPMGAGTDEEAGANAEFVVTVPMIEDALKTVLEKKTGELGSICRRVDEDDNGWIQRLTTMDSTAKEAPLAYDVASRTVSWTVTYADGQKEAAEAYDFEEFLKNEVFNLLNIPTSQFDNTTFKITLKQYEEATPPAEDPVWEPTVQEGTCVCVIRPCQCFFQRRCERGRRYRCWQFFRCLFLRRYH